MAEQKVILVQNLIAQNGATNSRKDFTNATASNIYVLGHQGYSVQENGAYVSICPVIDVNGRVISVFDGGGLAGYDELIANYSYALDGDNSLVIGGNYGNHRSFSTTINRYDWYTYDLKAMYLFSAPGGNNKNKIKIKTDYNAYHVTFNSWNGTQGSADTAGTIYFGGNNTLTLTAQAGAQLTQYYWDRQGFNSSATSADGTGSAEYWKTDDGIRLRSDNFALYGYLRTGNETGTESALGAMYDTTDPSYIHVPSKQTIAYVIHHNGNSGTTLTVASDLAGEITANVAAIHTGYITPKPEGSKQTYDDSNDDSSGNTVKAVGVKATNLTLKGNFRANIQVKNNAAAISSTNATDDASDIIELNDGTTIGAKRELHGWTVNKDQDGKIISFTINTTELSLTQYGSVFAGFASAAANNNTVENYGVLVDGGTVEVKDGVWSGEINVDTGNVAIIADYRYLRAETKNVNASATGNVVGAYGVKAGTIDIAKMGSLQKDYDNVATNTGSYASSITATTGGHYFEARGKGVTTDSGIIDGSASLDVKVTAAALYADSITIGEVTSGLLRDFEKEVASLEIGKRVMERLRELDQVAFVRFASVYRQFQAASDFVHEVKGLKK